ncbi:MAG: NADH-quinone oxidoreductase subunit NuoG [Chloroflexota bacterium]
MQQMITLTIDGQEIAVRPGATVLEAAAQLGIEIPTFCHHARLAPVGACRMCLVEIERMRGLQTACSTYVREGMTVRTNTPEVLKTRRQNLEFLLLHHPLDCPVCDKGGECELQDQVYAWGPGESRFIEAKQHKAKVYPLSDHIVLDQERCVLCRRCERFMQEWAGEPQIDLFERGRKSVIDVFPGQPFDSLFSGNTIDLCPVGALTSRVFRFRARVWEMERVPSVCIACGMGCNITLDVKNNRLRRIAPRFNREVNDRWLCDRGRFDHRFVEREDRLKTPLVRRDGELQPATWDEALALVAGRLMNVAQEHGPDSVGGIGSAWVANEANYLFQKLFRTLIGTNNLDYSGRMPDAARPVGAMADLRRADSVFLLGLDLLKSSPLIELFLRRIAVMYKVKLVVAHPREAPLARFGLWLPYRPGTEETLCQGLARAIVDTTLAKYPAGRQKEWQAWATAITVEQAAEATGASVEAIRQAAWILTEDRYGIAVHSTAEGRGPKGEANLEALRRMTAMAGSHGPFYIAERASTVGALDMGIAPHRLPGPASLDDAGARGRLAQAWAVKEKSLPSGMGLNESEMLRPGALKALYIMGSCQCPPDDAARQALAELDFLAVQDIFLTETAALADVVLPACSFAELDGTYTNLKGQVQRVQRALRPIGQSRADWQILADLGSRMAATEKQKSRWSYAGPAAILDEIAQAVPAYGKMSYATLGEHGQRRVGE